jgi:hypothetical protein
MRRFQAGNVKFCGSPICSMWPVGAPPADRGPLTAVNVLAAPRTVGNRSFGVAVNSGRIANFLNGPTNWPVG